MTELPQSGQIYRHYRTGHLYRVEAIGRTITAEDRFDWGRTSIKGLAHWSGDASVPLLIVTPDYEPMGVEGWFILGVGRHFWIDGRAVIYTALHDSPPGDSAPRLCVRPLHPELDADPPEDNGWLTPADTDVGVVERFTLV